jgi:signal transduction histidine kinase
VARELHDEVGQLLAAIRLSLAEVVGCVDDDERVRRGDRLELLIADAIESVRSLTFQLRQATPTSVAADRVGDGVDVVDVAQLVGALEGLADRIFRPRSIECAVRCRCPAHEVGAAIESSLVSVVRELFVNVVRHAHATAVSVSIVEAAGRLRLTVVDDGVGMPGDPVPGQRSGCGLEIVDERLREVGGSMRFDQVRRGTSITVTAPLTRTCVPPPG